MGETDKMLGLFVCNPQGKYCYAHEKLGRGGYHFEKCQVCGRNIAHPLPPTGEEGYILEGGKQFPDFLGYGGGGIYFIISDRVLNAFGENGVTGYDKAVEVPVYRKYRRELIRQDAVYYSVNITGSIDFDLKAMALKKKNRCPSCGQFDWSRQRLYLIKTVFDMNTWDGSDLCRIDSFPGHIVCTEKVKGVIEKYRFAGAELRTEDRIFCIS